MSALPPGSAHGFDWANRHREAVKGIAYMEAIIRPQSWGHWDKANYASVLAGAAFRGRRADGPARQLLYRADPAESRPAHALRRGDGGVPTALCRARRGATADADVGPADPH